MGNAMAKNIHRHLAGKGMPPLRFFHRTASKGDALEALGGVRCPSVAAVAAYSDVIFISVRYSNKSQLLSSFYRLAG